jgi:hypothetical protein
MTGIRSKHGDRSAVQTVASAPGLGQNPPIAAPHVGAFIGTTTRTAAEAYCSTLHPCKIGGRYNVSRRTILRRTA